MCPVVVRNAMRCAGKRDEQRHGGRQDVRRDGVQKEWGPEADKGKKCRYEGRAHAAVLASRVSWYHFLMCGTFGETDDEE